MSEKKIYYNVWTVIEKVTISDSDEVYEDLDETQTKIGKTYTKE